MNSMAAMLSCTFLTSAQSPVVSSEGQFIHDAIEESWKSIQRTRTLGRADFFDDLAELAQECATESWDGYGAAPLSRQAVAQATRFLRSLPNSAITPSLGAEPDGHVTVEWHVSPKRTLSVSISPDGELHYAALIGASRHFGTVPFLGDCPEVLLELIERIAQT